MGFTDRSPQKTPWGLSSIWTGQRSTRFQGADLKTVKQKQHRWKVGGRDPRTLEVIASFHLGGDRDRTFRKPKDHFETTLKETEGREVARIQTPKPRWPSGQSEASWGPRALQLR